MAKDGARAGETGLFGHVKTSFDYILVVEGTVSQGVKSRCRLS